MCNYCQFLFKIANFQGANVKIAEIWALCANYVLLFGTCTPSLPTPNRNPGSAPGFDRHRLGMPHRRNTMQLFGDQSWPIKSNCKYLDCWLETVWSDWNNMICIPRMEKLRVVLLEVWQNLFEKRMFGKKMHKRGKRAGKEKQRTKTNTSRERRR